MQRIPDIKIHLREQIKLKEIGIQLNTDASEIDRKLRNIICIHNTPR
jgi:hypothetical protein